MCKAISPALADIAANTTDRNPYPLGAYSQVGEIKQQKDKISSTGGQGLRGSARAEDRNA